MNQLINYLVVDNVCHFTLFGYLVCCKLSLLCCFSFSLLFFFFLSFFFGHNKKEIIVQLSPFLYYVKYIQVSLSESESW